MLLLLFIYIIPGIDNPLEVSRGTNVKYVNHLLISAQHLVVKQFRITKAVFSPAQDTHWLREGFI